MVGPVVWEMAGVAGLGWRLNNSVRERKRETKREEDNKRIR